MARVPGKKRQRTVSLNLDDVLTASDNFSLNVNDLLQYQRALAEVDLTELITYDLSEDLVLLCIAAKIGFLNAVLLRDCINQVPRAMLAHRKKYIMEEFNKLSKKHVQNIELYIDLMMSCCLNVVCETPKSTMKRYCL